MLNRTTKALAGTIAVAIACTLISATVVVAGSKARTGLVSKSVNKQTILWRTGKSNRAFTTSAKWAELPLPSGGCTVGQDTCSGGSPSEFMVSAKGPISLTFSGVFSRAPVELRFRDGARVMRPGAIRFRPVPGSNSVSFTFVSPRRGKRECTGPTMQWRSPTGKQTRLTKATIVVHYKEFVPKKPVGCL